MSSGEEGYTRVGGVRLPPATTVQSRAVRIVGGNRVTASTSHASIDPASKNGSDGSEGRGQVSLGQATQSILTLLQHLVVGGYWKDTVWRVRRRGRGRKKRENGGRQEQRDEGNGIVHGFPP
jgi:hypothetical protein